MMRSFPPPLRAAEDPGVHVWFLAESLPRPHGSRGRQPALRRTGAVYLELRAASAERLRTASGVFSGGEPPQTLTHHHHRHHHHPPTHSRSRSSLPGARRSERRRAAPFSPRHQTLKNEKPHSSVSPSLSLSPPLSLSSHSCRLLLFFFFSSSSSSSSSSPLSLFVAVAPRGGEREKAHGRAEGVRCPDELGPSGGGATPCLGHGSARPVRGDVRSETGTRRPIASLRPR